MLTTLKSGLAFIAIALVSLVAGCDDDGAASQSEYIIVNNVAGKGNFSLFTFPSKELINQFYTIDSDDFANPIYAAGKNDNQVVIACDFYPGKLRSIDVATGQETKDVVSWSDIPDSSIDFYNTNVIMSAVGSEYFTDGDRHLNIKIYDKNLSLQDSISGVVAYRLDAALVVGDKLFCSVTLDGGNTIEVMDLKTRTFVKSIDISSVCYKLFPLNGNEVIGVQERGFLRLDMGVLEVEEVPTTPSIGRFSALNASENVLYYLSPVAQPALVPWFLYKMDLSSKQTERIADSKEVFAEPIIYDEKAQVIVTGLSSQFGIKIFSRDGKVVAEANSAGKTTHILVR